MARTKHCGRGTPLPTRQNKNERKRKRGSSPEQELTAEVFLPFATKLSKITSHGSNLVFSPLSLRALLSLVAAGASSPTAEQLLSFLKSDSIDALNTLSSELFSDVFDDTSDAGGPKVSLANGIWVHDSLSLKQSFKDVASNVYNADIHRSNFTIAKKGEIESEANSWVYNKTDGLIGGLMDPGSVSETDRLILMNALYFKGAWPRDFFEPENTKEREFYLLDGTSIKVPFMENQYSGDSIRIFSDFKAVRLGYEQVYDDSSFCMYILLPDSVDGLPNLAERVASDPDFTENLCSYNDSVKIDKLRIPKFKFSFGFSASETLKQLGITLPFEDGSMSEMVDSGEEGERLFVNDIYQKAFIEVNEEGTTAVVVTGGSVGGKAPRKPPKKVDFVVDHPFMFLIREEISGAVLFLGHVLNPLKAQY